MDFLAATLIQHDRELTNLGDRLQESIHLLNKERLAEKYGSVMTGHLVRELFLRRSMK